MKQVLYCDEINSIVIKCEPSVDEVGSFYIPIEWDMAGIVEAERAREKRLQNMNGSCDLFDLFDWEVIGEL